MPTGQSTIDFGASPGGTDAVLTVTGQAAILSTSRVEAWMEVPATGTVDHNTDEHWAEELDVFAGNIVEGTGFTIYAKCKTGFTQGQFFVAWVWS